MKISPEVLAVLSAADTHGSRLYLRGNLDRRLYQAVNKVLEASGGKWSKKDKAHVFDGDAADEIEQALLTGEFQRVKQDLGQFDTPPDIALQVAQLAEIRTGMSVLEPNAGMGNLVDAAAASRPALIRAIELDESKVKRLHTRFDGSQVPVRISKGDFLAQAPSGGGVFDRIVMNPPFARQTDIDHVRHAMRFLRPDGRLVAIMSAAVTFRSNAKTNAFRALGGRVHRLPEGAFRVSGTMVNACVVILGR